MHFITIFFAILGSSLMAQAAPAVGTILGGNTIVGANGTYDIVDLSWDVAITNADAPYILRSTGTIQDALKTMATVDPAGAAAINNSIISTTTTSASVDLVSKRNVQPKYVATDHYCGNIAGGTASELRINQGIAYLRTVAGTPTNGPGPGACGRVSCAYGAAIYWCNDNLYTKVLDSYQSIAAGAALVVNYCAVPHGTGLNGQQFYQDGWNVIVGYANC